MFSEDELPVGSILEWSGTLATIPEDYHLCDGTNGTPNLVATFVRGAPASTEAGGTGGADSITLTNCQIPSHNHSVSDPQHHHAFGFGGSLGTPGGGQGNCAFKNWTSSTNSTGISLANAGGGGSHENRPAYYEVAFIMKVQ